MGRTVEELLSGLTIRALRDWQLFDAAEPIGNRELRMQLAHLCALLTNVYRAKGASAVDVDEFLLQNSEHVAAKDYRATARTASILESLALMARPQPTGYQRKRQRR